MFTNTKHTKKVYILILFIITLISIGLQFRKAFINNNTISRLIVNQFYFTTQSNYLVLITSFLLLIDKDCKLLKHITMYSIVVTGIIFHAFLAAHVQLDLVYHMLHSVTPLLFAIYYMFFNSDTLSIKEIYITLIHPIIFLLINYFILKPVFMDHLLIVRKSEFIYPFLDPTHFNNNYLTMILLLTFSYFILIFIINIISNYLIKVVHKS